MKTCLHTLDARDNVMLEVMLKESALSPDHILREIRWLLEETTSALAARGISYASLRPALVPSSTRREIALIFDSMRIGNAWYGLPIHRAVIPLLERKSCHSVLGGDLLGETDMQWRIRGGLEGGLVPSSALDYRHSTQYFALYINNLSDSMVRKLHEGLATFAPYVGFVDCTLGGFMKTYFSMTLVSEFVKRGHVIIQQHEDDLEPDANQNTIGYPFEEFGYTVRSIPSMLFGVLLSYKIERPVFPGFESDTEFSLNAVSTFPSQLDGFHVTVDPMKLKYLLENKSGSLRRAGLSEVQPAELEKVIAAKLQANYIYNMCQNDDHGVVKFNILVEHGECRLTVALEYVPADQTVRLITMY